MADKSKDTQKSNPEKDKPPTSLRASEQVSPLSTLPKRGDGEQTAPPGMTPSKEGEGQGFNPQFLDEGDQQGEKPSEQPPKQSEEGPPIDPAVKPGAQGSPDGGRLPPQMSPEGSPQENIPHPRTGPLESGDLARVEPPDPKKVQAVQMAGTGGGQDAPGVIGTIRHRGVSALNGTPAPTSAASPEIIGAANLPATAVHPIPPAMMEPVGVEGGPPHPADDPEHYTMAIRKR